MRYVVARNVIEAAEPEFYFKKCNRTKIPKQLNFTTPNFLKFPEPGGMGA